MNRTYADQRRTNRSLDVQRWLRSAYVFGSLLLASIAHAQQPACGQRPWIAVDFLEATWPTQFRETVLADLRASLSERRIDVCLPDQPTVRRPLARITLTAPSSVTVSIVVVANDETAQKRASRTVSLLTVPSDGRPFAVALATDELLQASWSELALLPPELETAPQPPPPPPPPPPTPAPKLLLVPPRLNSITGAALVDWFVSKQGYGGGELRLRRTLSDSWRWSLEGSVGGSLGRRLQTDHGTVTSNAILGAAWLRYVVQFVGNAQLGLAAGSRLGYHTFTGKPGQASDSAVTARSVSGWVSSLMGRFDVRIPFGGPMYCDLGVEVGFPLKSLQITDSGSVVTGATGLRFTPSAGAGLQW